MNQTRKIHQWTSRDKFLYFLAMIPFGIAFIGSIVLTATISIFFPIILIILFLVANFFQAGACVSCPYQGKFCPAILGVYLWNFLSTRIYKNRLFNQKFNKINASLAELCFLVILVLICISLFTLNILYPIIAIGLIILHFALFFAFICPKCGYNGTCPGGHTACKLSKKKCARYLGIEVDD